MLFARLTALLIAISACPALAAPNQGPQGAEEGQFRRQLWLVPSQDKSVLMRTNVLRPPGPGPFPLVVINHGSVSAADQRAKFQVPQFMVASEFFLARGYAVALPLRPGHGETGGPYLETHFTDGTDCDRADFRRAGFATADAIEAAIEFMLRQDFVRRDGAVVVGQSSGGWGALALASRNPRNVKAVINFSGGRGGHVHGRPNNNCAPERLVAAAGTFGATARIPVLSLYASNDTFFSAELARELNDAYRARGGKLDFRLLPAFSNDGHRLFGAREGVAIWGPIVEEFLKGLR
jgi:dienelactone hydrolase